MLQADIKEELISFLKSESKRFDVIVMPDFFYDRLISLDYNADSFTSLITNMSTRKGGSINGVKQTDIKGGNAINTASALAALGVNVTPIVCTNKLGLQHLELYPQLCIDILPWMPI